MNKTRKQIIFDLDTKELERYYPTENWRNAYNDIKKVMIEANFKWLEGSSYISNNYISYKKSKEILISLTEKYPYLHKCVRDCSLSSITRMHSQNKLFNKNIDIKPKRELKRGLKDMINTARIKANDHNKTIDKTTKSQYIEK